MVKAVFFDLDGTLLPMDEYKFTELYFYLLYLKAKPFGYEKDKLISTIYNGTKLMYKNDGSKTNEEVFWSYFVQVYGEEKLKDKIIFDEFYKNEFKQTKNGCKDNPLAREIISFCKKNFNHVILATNPIFPLEGTKTRMDFIGLKMEDFDYVTAYENSSYSKPNPMYFKTLLDKFNLKPEEVILFGNNVLEDGECSNYLNIKCYLINDCIIEYKDSKNTYERISMEEIIPTLKQYLESK